jgi:hypothetical protein
LLAEPNAYRIDPTEPANSNVTGGKKQTGRQHGGSKQTKKKKRPAGLDAATSAEIEIHDDSPGGGIDALIQTSACRRAVITKVFGNPPPREYD